MLIKQTRIQTTSGSGKIINHVFDKPQENEKIDVIQGDRSLVDSCFDMSESMEKKYAVRHFIVSSLEPLTPEQNQKIFNMIGEEFGFSIDDSTIVEHKKRRQDGTGWDYHHHILQSEILPDGRIMSNRGTMLRNEKLSRRFEIEEGLKLIPGKWNQAVQKAFVSEGLHMHAEKMESLCNMERPGAAYSFGKHQEMKRKGKSMPAIKSKINEMWEQSDGIKSFVSMMSDSGFSLQRGTKNQKTFIIMDDEGNQIGTAARIIKSVRQNQFLEMMESLEKEKTDGIIQKQRGHKTEATRKEADVDIGNRKTEISEGATIRESPRGDVRGGDENRHKGSGNLDAIKRTQGIKQRRPDSGTQGFANKITGEPGQDSGRIKRADYAELRRKKIERARLRQALGGFHGNKSRQFSDRKILEIEEIKKLSQDAWSETQKKKKEYYEQMRAISHMQNLMDAHNNAIASNFGLMITDFILGLFGYTLKKIHVQQPRIDVIPPSGLESISRDKFHSMTESQQDYFVRQSLKRYQNEYARYVDLCDRQGINHVSTFMEYLKEARDNGGDWMTEEMINMYPQEYIKRLEASENVEDRRVFDELRRLVNDEEGTFPGDHNAYSSNQIRDNIEAMETLVRKEYREHLKEEIELKRLRDEWNTLHAAPPGPAEPPAPGHTEGIRIK